MNTILSISVFTNLFMFGYLLWRESGDSPEQLNQMIRRNYKAERNQGRISENTRVDDHISNIAGEMSKLDEICFAENYFRNADNEPYLVHQCSEPMAEIIMAVTNMAEFYGIDILNQITENTLKNEQSARN